MNVRRIGPYLQALPLTVLVVFFVGIPLITVFTVSFWEFDDIDLHPAFLTENYTDILTDSLTWDLFLTTFKNAALTWLFTLVIGFTCSYFLVFHVRRLRIQIALFLLCTIPFWTSNIIRMISWIPFLGREGIFNQTLISLGLVDVPLEFLLFSDFAVILAYVHLFTLFMIVPIFNSMAKINPSVIEAARDAGADGWQVMMYVIIPLCKTGITLGSIFVITLVMGDFFVITVMGGGQSASVVSAMKNEINQLYYPRAAAMAVLLVAVVATMLAFALRVVDIRKELAG